MICLLQAYWGRPRRLSPTPFQSLCALFRLNKTSQHPHFVLKDAWNFVTIVTAKRVAFNPAFYLHFWNGWHQQYSALNFYNRLVLHKLLLLHTSAWGSLKKSFLFFISFLQERNRSSVSLRDATEDLQTAATERNTCTFTRRTSHISAKCATSLTHIPALYENTWR